MSETASLLIYIFGFSLAALFLHFGNKRRNKFLIGLSLAIPIVIGSLRYGVGTDYVSYAESFARQTSISFSDFFSSFSFGTESGFYLLSKFSQYVSGSYFILFSIYSFLTVMFFYLGLRRYSLNRPALVYYLYLMILFPTSFNLVRQSLAASICFYAVSFIISRNPIKYIGLVLLASFFHTSALIMLPVYLINRLIKPTSKGYYNRSVLKVVFVALLLLTSLPLLFSLTQYLHVFSAYSKYQANMVEQGRNYIIYLKFVTLAAILLFYRSLISKNKVNVYYLTFAIFEIVLSTLGFTSAFTKRIALYFAPFILMLLVGVIDIFTDRLGKTLSTVLVILYGLIYFIFAYYVLGQSNIFPYVLNIGVRP